MIWLICKFIYLVTLPVLAIFAFITTFVEWLERKTATFDENTYPYTIAVVAGAVWYYGGFPAFPWWGLVLGATVTFSYLVALLYSYGHWLDSLAEDESLVDFLELVQDSETKIVDTIRRFLFEAELFSQLAAGLMIGLCIPGETKFPVIYSVCMAMLIGSSLASYRIARILRRTEQLRTPQKEESKNGEDNVGCSGECD